MRPLQDSDGAQVCNLTEPCDLPHTLGWGLWPQCHPSSSSQPPWLHQLIPAALCVSLPSLHGNCSRVHVWAMQLPSKQAGTSRDGSRAPNSALLRNCATTGTTPYFQLWRWAQNIHPWNFLQGNHMPFGEGFPEN